MATSIITSYVPIVDSNGTPYPRTGVDTACRVFVCQPGTTTLMNVFSDDDLLVSASNPITVTAGRHAQRFIANQAYKLVVEINGTTTIGSGTTLSSWGGDNIDPGISVGTGSLSALLGVAGVGSIGAFRTLIAAPAQTEMDTATTNIANLVTWTGYNLTTKSRMATGTTAQQPAAGTAGSYRFDTTLVLPLVDNGSAWKKIAIEGKLDNTYFATSSIAFPLQRSRNTSTATTGITAAIPIDTSKPQIGEGTEVFSVSFTPRSASSVLYFDCLIRGSIPSAGNIVVAIFKDSDADAIAATFASLDTASAGNNIIHLRAEVSAAAATARTYSVRVGTSSGTFTLNGGGSSTLGGLMQSEFVITEVLAI